MDKVTEINRVRAEKRTGIANAINPTAAAAHLGEVRAVVVIAVLEDLSLTIEAAGITEADKMTVIGALEKAKSDLLKE